MKVQFVSVKPGDIRIATRIRKDLGDLTDLADSIREVGMVIEPIILAGDQLVAGERRLAAAKLAGLENLPCIRLTDVEPGRLLDIEAHENFGRKDFSPTEKVEAMRRFAKKADPDAGEKPGGGVGRSVAQAVAPLVGSSYRTLEKAEQVVLAAESDPKLKPVVEEMDRTGNVDAAFKEVQAKTPASKKEKPPRKPLKDANGAEVPSHLRDIFGDPWLDEAVAEMATIIESVKAIGGRVKKKGPAYQFIQAGLTLTKVEKAVAVLEEIQSGIRAGKPHLVCVVCGGQGKKGKGNCDQCRGSGAIPDWRESDKV